MGWAGHWMGRPWLFWLYIALDMVWSGHWLR